jgi:hypothetical protein
MGSRIYTLFSGKSAICYLLFSIPASLGRVGAEPFFSGGPVASKPESIDAT